MELDLNSGFTFEQIHRSTMVNADCFDVFPHIATESVDAVICDLPYGVTNCRWDSPLDLQKLWAEYNRVLKPNGVAVLFAQTPFDKVLGCSNLEHLKYEWIWEKTQATGHFNAKKAPMKAHENILIFCRGTAKYNPQKTEGHKPINPYTKKASVINRTEVYGKVKQDISGGGETDRYPRSVQVFASDKQTSKIKGLIHPTQKPIKLLEYLVKTYTDEGDLVLDNTCGIATTNLACNRLNRRSIGVEKEAKYYALARERLRAENG